MQKRIRFILSLQGILWFVMAFVHWREYGNMAIAIMLAVDGLGFLVLAFLYSWRKLFRFATLFYLLVNIALTITDQMGLADYLVLALNMIVTLLVIIDLRGGLVPKESK